MKIHLLPLFLSLLMSSCLTGWTVLQSNVETMPLYPISPAPDELLLLNTYDISAQKFRGNKEQLFVNLVDSVLIGISTDVRRRSGIESKIVYGLTKTGTSSSGRDSAVQSLMKKHNASHAIAITFIDVYFDQTDVEVTKDDSGTSREAFYDIVSNINYVLYNRNGVFKDLKVDQRRFHSSRAVLSGLLAAGANVVKNSEDAAAISRHNVEAYLNNFFPGRADRTRVIFVGKELEGVKTALVTGDYETAMEESRRFILHPDHKLAAKANYNCAVLFERSNQHSQIKLYLEQSLGLYNLPQARSMMNDY